MRSDALALANTLDQSLHDRLLAPWFPACVAEEGFHQGFSEDWIRQDSSDRHVVFQARMTWLSATLAESASPRAAEFAAYAMHGNRFLGERLLDPATGAARWTAGDGGERHAYGHSFALYALAAVARALGDEAAKARAIRLFEYLEASHRDPVHGGYFEVTAPDGTPVTEGTGRDAIGTPYGLKSQNTHLHLLEAYAELARVWPEPRLLRCLQELVDLFLGPLYAAPGWLHVYAERDWTPVPGDLSHGHDVEAAHLVEDAARRLGQDVTPFATALLDYALETGWLPSGGLVYTGRPDGTVVDETLNWWAQAEGLLGLATVWRLTGEDRYFEALLRQWNWIRDHQIDPVHGGWIESVLPDGTVPPRQRKGHAWKAAYHDGRAMLFTARRLRGA